MSGTTMVRFRLVYIWPTGFKPYRDANCLTSRVGVILAGDMKRCRRKYCEGNEVDKAVR